MKTYYSNIERRWVLSLQRDGRIVRQGNKNKEVEIYKYVTENTFDSYSWTLLANKQKFIGQIYTSKKPERSADDVDNEALSYEEVKALSTNNPIFREKMELDVDVAKLKTSRKIHNDHNMFLEDKIIHIPTQIKKLEQQVSNISKDIELVAENPITKDTFTMEIKGEIFTDKKQAGEKIIDLMKNLKGMETVDIGNYRGFKMKISNILSSPTVHLVNNQSYSIPIENSAIGNISRLDNCLERLPNKLDNKQNQLISTKQELELAKNEVGKPFLKEKEFQEKSQRLSYVNKEIEDIEAKLDEPEEKTTQKPKDNGSR